MPATTQQTPDKKKKLTSAERKELIFRRRRESFFWWAVSKAGSLKFAVILLVTIAVIIGTATVVESVYDTPVALYYIYNSPWFILWLVALCVNLTAAAFSRWPWQRKHTGFVVTHLGIILMLIGSMIGMIWGFEAYVTLRVDGPARDTLFGSQMLIKVQTSPDGGIDQADFPVEAYMPTPESPMVESLPHTDLSLVVTGYSQQLQQVPVVVASTEPGAPAGLDLAMNSAMMGQELELPFLIEPDKVAEQALFTMAKIEVHPELPAAAGLGQPQPVDFDNIPRAEVFREMHVILANHPEQPIITSDMEKPSGYHFGFEKNAESEKGFNLVLNRPDGGTQSWPLEEVLGRATLAANGSLQVVVAEYWPDFDISSGQPVNKSDEPNNPAVRLEIFGARAAHAPAKPTLQLAPAGEGEIAYRLLRENKPVGEGTMKEGDVLPLGWADWHLTLRRLLPQARMSADFREAPMNANPPGMGEAPRAMRGIQAHLAAPDGRAGESRWLVGGMTHTLFVDGRPVKVWFGPKAVELDFDVKLTSFEVPRDQGTDQPADFISQLKFTDKATGATATGEAHMNEPALYPDSFWRAITGQTYKFSQAGWNRNDLNESSLQVLYDPGWLLKWIGSLCICIGIFMLFYMKGYGREPVPDNASTTPSAT